MSTAKKTRKYKESPYYGGGYAEAKKSNSKPHDGKALDDHNPPRQGTKLGVLKLSRNLSKREAPSGGEGSSQVQSIASSFEKPSSRSKDTKISSLITSVIPEGDELNEEYEHDRFDAFGTRSHPDRIAYIDTRDSSKSGSDASSFCNKPYNSTHEAKSRSYNMLDDGTQRDSNIPISYSASFSTPVKVDDKDGCACKILPDMQGSLPSQNPLPVGLSFMSLTKNQGFAGASRQVSFMEERPSYEENLILEDGKPHRAVSHEEEALDRNDDDQMTKFTNKDHQIAVRFTGDHENERIFLSGVASAFYNGGSLSLHGVLSCSSIAKLNDFLDERCDELHVGVPGKWLTIVLGKESSELSTVAATIMYSYFLSHAAKQDQLCIIPLINMARADLALNPDITWLLTSIGLHIDSLLFQDEINLSYFHRFGNLRLVLVNHTELCPSQQSFKDDVEEILAVRDKDVGSSCTIIAEKYTKHHPQLLAGRALCRLLLAGILMDTKNLTTETTTRRDISMATMLINGAGKFGRNGLFRILKQKSHDLIDMNTKEVLRKQFKKLKLGSSGEEAKGGNSQQYEESLGMSSLPIPLSELLAWEENSLNTIVNFPSDMELGLFVLVTGYYTTMADFKREVLLVAEDNQLVESLSEFLLANNTSVNFVPMLMPGLPSCVRAFSLKGTWISRTVIRSIIEHYFSG